MDTVFDKIEESVTFDDAGNLPRGENGDRLPPAEKPAENTAAALPSPDPVPPPAPAEDKSGAAPKADEPGTPTAKTSTPDESKFSDEETAALKEKHSKPGETGNEWQIRAAREGHKLRKQFEPVNDVMERIGSPDRARRGLELTAELADPEVAIESAWDKMTALSSSRAEELHNHLYNTTLDAFPDVVASDLVGEKATAAELKEGLALLRSGATKTAQPQSTVTTAEVQKPEGMSDEDWADFQIDYPEAYKAMQAQAKQPEKPAEAKEPELSPAEKQLKEIQEKQRDEFVSKKVAEIQEAGDKMYADIYGKVVDSGLRDLGLVPDPAKHDEKQVKLIERTAKRIQESVEKEFDGPDGPEGPMDYSLLSEEQKQNRKLVEKVIGLLAKGDIVAARDYEDRIAAQVDLAFQRAVDPEIELYNAAMLQSTNKTRDSSQHTRPELVGGTAPGGATVNKTPWLDPGYRQPGETSQQAMMRYLESQAA